MAAGKLKWWQKTLVYEVYVKSFLDTRGAGTGTIAGSPPSSITCNRWGGRPVADARVRSPMVDNGYDVSDFCAIDPSFGTMDDMDRLIAQAGQRGIRIVLDLVLNHTSEECPWFMASAASRTGAYADWYIWRDPAPDGGAPTNWRSVFGGPAWEYVPARGQYYLHTFAKEQPDLNWENPAVRDAMCQVGTFWLDRGAGGFRIDSVSYLKKPAFTDGPADGTDGLAGIDLACANTPGVLDFVKEFYTRVLAGRDVFAVGEANRVRARELAQWVGRARALDMVFEFSHLQLIMGDGEVWCRAPAWQLADLKRVLADDERRTARQGWLPVFFECHDQPRAVSNFFAPCVDRQAAAKALACVLLTLRGTPFIYQGQELGLTNAQWPGLSSFDDGLTRGQYQRARDEGFSADAALDVVRRFSRDNARTPMQWNGGPNAGFTTGTPWLPVHADYRQQNAAGEDADLCSVLNWYRFLACLRLEHSELVDGDFHLLLRTDAQVFAYARENRTARAVVLVNFTDAPATYRASLVGGMRLIADFRAAVDAQPGSAAGATETLPGVLAPLQAVVYERPAR